MSWRASRQCWLGRATQISPERRRWTLPDVSRPRRPGQLAREVRATLQSVRDPVRQSLAWRAVAMASVRLGSYAAALEDEGLTLNPNDEIIVYTAIIRDDALRRNCVLGDLFDRALIDSLGRLGLHWP